MTWQEEKARTRISRFIESVPQGEIVVEDFSRFLAESRAVKAGLGLSDAQAALVKIPRNRAITTHSVHVYANLIDFNSVLTDAGRETEASHRRALEFLHAHYSACDALIDEFDLQRVDFHSSRLHAVVLTPEGRDQEQERAKKAFAFSAAFREMVAQLGRDYPEFVTAVRIGVDSGPAVAIDNGKAGEAEPLFIGSPANHAAKLADGEEAGIFPSPRVRALLSQADSWDITRPVAKSVEYGVLTEDVAIAGATLRADVRLERAYASLKEDIAQRRSSFSDAVFRFHHKEPPLKSIDFAEHPPSNAIRMPLASIFADIDGFTAYVDNALRTGRVAEAVANLHVMRAEMAAVLRDDFGGRKVRFIGDCIHGLVAEGSARDTNTMDTIRMAVKAAGGIRSSFELCQTMLPGVTNLGLAVGIDFGETPICRIGLRGAFSVRSATSRATCVSEGEQRRCAGDETAIGEHAYKQAPAVVRQVFSTERKIPNLTFATAEVLLGLGPINRIELTR